VAWTLFSDPKGDKKVLIPKVKEQLLKAIKISPNSATSHHFLGEVYLGLGEERRAFTCFDKVLDIQPDHLESQRHMRIIRMRKEKRKEDEKKKAGLFGRFRKK
jgi:tetratricopeptide (TPR) repeat protein